MQVYGVLVTMFTRTLHCEEVLQRIYEVSLHARCIDAKKKDLTLALVNQEGLPVCQTKIKVQGADWKDRKSVV